MGRELPKFLNTGGDLLQLHNTGRGLTKLVYACGGLHRSLHIRRKLPAPLNICGALHQPLIAGGDPLITGGDLLNFCEGAISSRGSLPIDTPGTLQLSETRELICEDIVKGGSALIEGVATDEDDGKEARTWSFLPYGALRVYVATMERPRDRPRVKARLKGHHVARVTGGVPPLDCGRGRAVKLRERGRGMN